MNPQIEKPPQMPPTPQPVQPVSPIEPNQPSNAPVPTPNATVIPDSALKNIKNVYVCTITIGILYIILGLALGLLVKLEFLINLVFGLFFLWSAFRLKNPKDPETAIKDLRVLAIGTLVIMIIVFVSTRTAGGLLNFLILYFCAKALQDLGVNKNLFKQP